MERQERISINKKMCMQNLHYHEKNIGVKQERQDNQVENKGSQIKYSFGFRFLVAIMFFLFLFEMKQESLKIAGWTCERICNCVLEDTWTEKMDRKVEEIILKPIL